jgi:hypothetical protein
MPIQACDDADGCDQYVIDWWQMGVREWADLLAGWTFDRTADYAFCPEHKPDEVQS